MAKKTDELARRLAALKDARNEAKEEKVRADTTHSAAEANLTKIEGEIKERWGKTPAELTAWAQKEAKALEKKVSEMEAAVGGE